VVLEARAADALLDLLGVSSIDLVLKEAKEKVPVSEVLLGRLAGAEVERLQCPRQPELLQERDQLVNGAHSASPSCSRPRRTRDGQSGRTMA
jgi:hypothetical protein